MSEYVAMINAAAREEGKYRAIGGHRANDYGANYTCSVCGRRVRRSSVTLNGVAHASSARSHGIQPIPAVKQYFNMFHPEHNHQTPNIFEVYWPGKGWVRQAYRKRVSVSTLRQLRRQGATAVALSVGPFDYIVADFQIKELV